jgi:cation transport protein ChaC
MGSLIWRSGFPYLNARPAYIGGLTRRFWQGSHDHRGVEAEPGRTVTLVEAPGERCYGRPILAKPGVFEYLDERERNGYQRHSIDICFDDARMSGIVYIAETTNPAYLGEAILGEIAAQIRCCSGRSGTNMEFLMALPHALRQLNVSDPHVFELETRVLAHRTNELDYGETLS